MDYKVIETCTRCGIGEACKERFTVLCATSVQQFGLPNDVKNLFTVEVMLNHSRTKDHLPCETGEVLFVLLIAHDKMPQDRYLVEKEDGTG